MGGRVTFSWARVESGIIMHWMPFNCLPVEVMLVMTAVNFTTFYVETLHSEQT